MLLIQHCALKNRFEDKWPLGWAARRAAHSGLAGPPRKSPLADCGQALRLESLLSRQHSASLSKSDV